MSKSSKANSRGGSKYFIQRIKSNSMCSINPRSTLIATDNLAHQDLVQAVDYTLVSHNHPKIRFLVSYSNKNIKKNYGD